MPKKKKKNYTHILPKIKFSGATTLVSSTIIIRFIFMSIVSKQSLVLKSISVISLDILENGKITNEPRNMTSASMTASIGGDSTALLRNWSMAPSRRSLINNETSCKGVLNISGVMCSSSFSYRAWKNILCLHQCAKKKQKKHRMTERMCPSCMAGQTWGALNKKYASHENLFSSGARITFDIKWKQNPSWTRPARPRRWCKFAREAQTVA